MSVGFGKASMQTWTNTQITATVKLNAGVLTQTACLYTMFADGDNWSLWTPPMTPSLCSATGGFPIQIGCPTPIIVSVSPRTWFAGETYDKDVIITGTGFVTQTASAKSGCPVTPVTIAAADGTSVAVGSVKVDSDTKITLNGIAPPDDLKTQSATLTAGTAPNAGTFSTLDILGAPQIVCTGVAMQCNGMTISGASASLQTVVVGQTLNLTAEPSAATLSALPVPVTFSTTKPNTWTLTDGMNIGGYPIVPPSPPSGPSSAKVTATVLNKPDLATYWLYPNGSVPVEYQYCVNIPGASPVRQCSTTATATFNVTGPTAQITPLMTMPVYPFATGQWSISTGFTGCPNNTGELTQFIFFGDYMAPAGSCSPTMLDAGIAFEAANVNLANVTAPAGTFEWVQLITEGRVSGTVTSGTSPKSTNDTGLDNTYPYQDFITSPYNASFDAPGVGLDNALATETLVIHADMYLTWNSNLDSYSIAVPIGYETWKINGTAKNNTKASPPWTLSIATIVATAATSYTASNAQQPSYGMPTWTQATYNTPTTTVESESVPTDGEEESQQ